MYFRFLLDDMQKNTYQELLKLLYKKHENEYHYLPSRQAITKWFQDFFNLFFPPHILPSKDLEWQLKKNEKLLLYIINKIKKNEEEANKSVEDFYAGLVHIYAELNKDANDIYSNDPAANSLSEVVNSYPGFYAIAVYRIAHFFEKNLQLPLVPRILSEYAHHKTGIDIHPGAEIGAPFFIDHGTGIVIGETCKIGKNVKIYQGVTLGALQVDKSMADVKRHPTIEDHVIIYANATILGGDTIVGNHSVIGGNVFLTESVNPYSVVFHTNKVSVKDRKNTTNVINFVI